MPRLLSCLCIKRVVANTPARLDTWPAASGYQGGSRTPLECAALPSRDQDSTPSPHSNWTEYVVSGVVVTSVTTGFVIRRLG
jgi:hypothetical protein